MINSIDTSATDEDFVLTKANKVDGLKRSHVWRSNNKEKHNIQCIHSPWLTHLLLQGPRKTTREAKMRYVAREFNYKRKLVNVHNVVTLHASSN